MLLVAVGGVALALAFPEPSVTPLAWVALVPLLLGARRRSAALGFALGAVFGVGFFGLLIVWISLVGWVAWAVLVALQALYIGAFGACWAMVSRRRSVTARVLLGAACWVGIEYLRSRFPAEGFSWGQLAQSQHNLGWILRLAPVTGGWGIGFLLVAVNALVAEGWLWIRAGERRAAAEALGTALVLVAGPALLPQPLAEGSRLRVAIAQGNVARGFPADLVARQTAILRRHERLTKSLAGRPLDLVVWPESSVELDLPGDPAPIERLRASARSVSADLIAGVNDDVSSGLYRVLALHVDPHGGVAGRYQKMHRVPFGEYIPARRLLEWIPLLDQIPRDALPGEAPGVFDLSAGKVAVVISFEGDFGSLVREPIATGGRLLVVATNTSTWGRSWASAQHLAFSQVRAAENAVWVVHGALSGISAFVAPDGAVVASTPLWTETTLLHGVRFSTSETLYTRYGDFVAWLSLVVAITGVLASSRRPL